MILDISPPLHAGVAVWPGDVAFSRRVSLSIRNGDHIDLSAVTTTVHAGAHADAPSHYVAGGAGIDAVPLSAYLGPCQVMRVAARRGERIRPADLPGPLRAPRVLLATGTFPDPDEFNPDFAALHPELVHHLAAAGVVLVGIDTPSVDLFADRDLPAHQALARHCMANLECLLLGGVDPGLYQLAALPLRLVGADASPVRAVLFRDPL